MNEIYGQLSLIEQQPKIILLSLREEYFNQMVDGSKRYEYRTRFLKEPCTAYVYISKTKKSIIARLDLGEPIIGNAEEISRLADNEEPGCYQAMIEYLYNDLGFAIPVNGVTLLTEEVTLADLKSRFPDFVPPQSYFILDKKPELLNYLESFVGEKQCSRKR